MLAVVKNFVRLCCSEELLSTRLWHCSRRQAEFMELQCNLTAEQQAVYDAAVQLWQSLRQGLAAALVQTNTTSRELWKPFWSAQQRFFKLLCVSLKASAPSPYSPEGFTSGCNALSHLIWLFNTACQLEPLCLLSSLRAVSPVILP